MQNPETQIKLILIRRSVDTALTSEGCKAWLPLTQ